MVLALHLRHLQLEGHGALILFQTHVSNGKKQYEYFRSVLTSDTACRRRCRQELLAGCRAAHGGAGNHNPHGLHSSRCVSLALLS